MSGSGFGKILVVNRDIFISFAVLILVVAFVLGLYSIYGVSLTFALPITFFFYKLFTVLAFVYAIIIIAVNNDSKKYVISNYSLLALYSASVVLFLAFIVVSYLHFEMSVNGVIKFITSSFRFPAYTEYFLYMIYFSQLMVMIFFLISLASRTRRIGFKIVQKIYYGNFYGNILDYIYGDKQVRYNSLSILRRMLYNRFSKETFINTLNMFNVNFKGELKARTHDLYFDLKLNEYVRDSLKSFRNVKVFWAIKMLSSFNDTTSVSMLKAKLRSQNRYLRFETLIGLIKLNEIDFVLDYLYKSPELVTEFSSIKIVSAIRLSSGASKDYGFLLDSNNDGVTILGLNLINEFGQEEHIERVKAMLVHQNVKVAQTAIRTLMTLDYIDFEKHVVEAIKDAPERNKVELINSVKPYFTEDSLLWAKDYLVTETNPEVRIAILRMMCALISRPEIIVNLYDEPQKSEVKQLIDDNTKKLSQ